jgi:hypothetical protein
MAICAGNTFAALLGVQPAIPQITFDSLSYANPYGTSYDATTRIFSIHASPVSYVWGVRKLVAIGGTRSLAIQAHLNGSGQVVPDGDGDGIVITGDILPTSTYTGPAYTGTLLTGKLTRFGYYNGGTTDSYDFRFTPTGGALYEQYKSYDIGVTVTSENSTFNGSFTDSFMGVAKGTVGTIAGPHLDLNETCTNTKGQDPMQFSATLTNTGTETLTNITCTGSPDVVLSGVPTSGLPPGASAVITGSYQPTSSPSTSTISCSAQGSGSLVTVTKSSSATCSVLATPALAVTSTCADAEEPGRPISISATITNTGNETLTGVTCYDSMSSALTGVPLTLAPGATAVVTGSYLPTGSGSTDTVTCSARGAVDGTVVSASASSTCNIITKPALTVAETCTNAPAPGLPITLSALISNTGNEILTGITCNDSKGALLTGIPATLAPGASAPLGGSYTPSGTPSTDTITCSATGGINGSSVTGNSSSTCSVLNPAIRIVKYTNGVDAPTAPGPTIPFGAEVTWTYTVTNTGNVPLANVTVTDDKLAAVFCPATTLAVGGAMTCMANGTATVGQYENIGTATGSSGGVAVASSYPSHYYGSTTSGCTYTQGFWKNHPERWRVASLSLGTTSYSRDQLVTILQTPVQGNGLVSLVHQLIAAKLNQANGASLTPAVRDAINAADRMIGSMIVPPIGKGYLPPTATSAIEAILDAYNNGFALTGPGHCP